jgi:hypothetical protein
MVEWQSRCLHGHIIIACPYKDCPTRIAYLDQHDAAVRDYLKRHTVIPQQGDRSADQ